jgi:hypothetical protein
MTADFKFFDGRQFFDWKKFSIKELFFDLDNFARLSIQFGTWKSFPWMQCRSFHLVDQMMFFPRKIKFDVSLKTSTYNLVFIFKIFFAFFPEFFLSHFNVAICPQTWQQYNNAIKRFIKSCQKCEQNKQIFFYFWSKRWK